MPGASIHSEYVICHGDVGGCVRLCGSCVVFSPSTLRGVAWNRISSTARVASSTGSRPLAVIACSTACTSALGAPAMTAVGTLHIPRITWANSSAAGRSMITTDMCELIVPHNRCTASACPAPV